MIPRIDNPATQKRRGFCLTGRLMVVAPATLLAATLIPVFARTAPHQAWAARATGVSRAAGRAGHFLHVNAQARQAKIQDGSIAHPFSTIQAAADQAGPGTTVVIHAGDYRETVVPRQSGLPDAPIVFQPFQNDHVCLRGTAPVTGWKPDTSRVFQAPLPGNFYVSNTHYSDQIFVDGKMMNLARWPHTSLDVSHPQKATTTKFLSKTTAGDKWTTASFSDDALPFPDGFLDGAEIVVQPNNNAWSWELSGVVTHCANHTITLKTRSGTGKDGNQGTYDDKSRYFVFNKRSLLDAPGEWFHDREAGILFLQTPQGDSPAKHLVEARQRDYGFNLSGRSYITLRGLEFFACTVTTDTDAGGDAKPYEENGNDRYPWRGKGTVAPAHHLVLDRLTVLYPSHYTDVSGHFFLQWGQNTGVILSGSDNVLSNSVIRYSAGNGVTLLGSRNKVLNNRIGDVDYNATDAAGIASGGAADSFDDEIAYNTIRRCGRSGITPRNLRNAQPGTFVARIHHNDISQCMLQDWDGGAIYGVGDGTFVRIDHNWCHDIAGFAASGIYPDALSNWIIDHNVVWNVEWGIHLQNNGDVVANALCYNNTILVSNTSASPYGPFGFANGVNKGRGNYIANNLIACLNPSDSKGYKPFSDNFDESEKVANHFWDAVPASPTDPRFVNLTGWSLSLLPTSPLINKGILVPTLQRGGISIPGFNDPIVGNAPDIGAYEQGGKVWQAGSTLK